MMWPSSSKNTRKRTLGVEKQIPGKTHLYFLPAAANSGVTWLA